MDGPTPASMTNCPTLHHSPKDNPLHLRRGPPIGNSENHVGSTIFRSSPRRAFVGTWLFVHERSRLSARVLHSVQRSWSQPSRPSLSRLFLATTPAPLFVTRLRRRPETFCHRDAFRLCGVLSYRGSCSFVPPRAPFHSVAISVSIGIRSWAAIGV